MNERYFFTLLDGMLKGQPSKAHSFQRLFCILAMPMAEHHQAVRMLSIAFPAMSARASEDTLLHNEFGDQI